mmetsp:Transcript_78704/g.168667  ORF Transcript_78704/g.168667 Transcript_78704/m.168667 type:complete len:326 (-) Transcript_78704:3353-4330(-)
MPPPMCRRCKGNCDCLGGGDSPRNTELALDRCCNCAIWEELAPPSPGPSIIARGPCARKSSDGREAGSTPASAKTACKVARPGDAASLTTFCAAEAAPAAGMATSLPPGKEGRASCSAARARKVALDGLFTGCFATTGPLDGLVTLDPSRSCSPWQMTSERAASDSFARASATLPCLLVARVGGARPRSCRMPARVGFTAGAPGGPEVPIKLFTLPLMKSLRPGSAGSCRISIPLDVGLLVGDTGGDADRAGTVGERNAPLLRNGIAPSDCLSPAGTAAAGATSAFGAGPGLALASAVERPGIKLVPRTKLGFPGTARDGDASAC